MSGRDGCMVPFDGGGGYAAVARSAWTLSDREQRRAFIAVASRRAGVGPYAAGLR